MAGTVYNTIQQTSAGSRSQRSPRTLQRMNWLSLSLLFPLLTAAASAGTANDRPAPVSFESDIRPLFQSKCLRCHGEKTQKAGLSLLTPETIRKGSESGPIIVPGK